MKNIISNIFFLIIPFFTNAQTLVGQYSNGSQNSQLWLQATGTIKCHKNLSVFYDFQGRRVKLGKASGQTLSRVGLLYAIAPNTSVAGGYCYVYTSPYGVNINKTNFPEHRVWQQIQIKNQIENVEFIVRFRQEQRWVRPVNADLTLGSPIYSNRTRISNRFSIPFKGKTIEDKSLYLTAFDELFINFGTKVKANIFDQNRFFIGLGFKIPKWGRFEIGYLNQFIFRPDGINYENNHTINISLNSSLEFRKKRPKMSI